MHRFLFVWSVSGRRPCHQVFVVAVCCPYLLGCKLCLVLANFDPSLFASHCLFFVSPLVWLLSSTSVLALRYSTLGTWSSFLPVCCMVEGRGSVFSVLFLASRCRVSCCCLRAGSTRHLILLGPRFRHSFAAHCRIPLCAPDTRCQYCTQTQGLPCHALLGTRGHRIHAVEFGPRQRRHDAMRDCWATLLKRARWTVASEQLLHIGPHQTKRADLLVTTTGGTAFALDLTFSAPLVDDGPPGDHMQPRREASCPTEPNLCRSPTLPPGPCGQDSPAWGFHLSAATDDFAASLGRVYAMWLWRQAFACCPQ